MYKGKGLIGYLSENDAIQMLAIGLKTPDNNALKQKWQQVTSKTQQRSYSTDFNPEIKDIPSSPEVDAALGKISTRLNAQPIFGNSWKFKMIEIDKLVIAQKTVNVDVATGLVQNVRDSNDIVGAIKVALNSEIREDTINMIQDPATGWYNITCRNNNFGIINIGAGTVTLGGENDKTGGVNFTFGTKLSYAAVVHYADRFILIDGYHRVYGLKSKGFTHTPCIFIETNEQGMIPQGNNLFPLQTMLSSNPPLYRDFTDVAEDIQMLEVVNVVRVKIEESRMIV